MTAKWIWYYGEFETYHNILLHSRRENYPHIRPAFWDVPSTYTRVDFRSSYDAPEDFDTVFSCKGQGLITLDEKYFFNANGTVTLPAGRHTVLVSVLNHGGLPCLFADGKYLKTDGAWLADHGKTKKAPVGCVPEFTSPEDDPQVFPFAYEDIFPVSTVTIDGGAVYDFGRETFASLVISGLDKDSTLLVKYGESYEEATSPAAEPYCMFWEELSGVTEATLRPRAFRYIAIMGEIPPSLTVTGRYEYLPIEKRGAFTASDPLAERIFDTCAYTFHLCSREFYIDGIKRDRWVWSGDARQSFMINGYVFADREICRRTILSLLPKDCVYQHVNTINDYSAYLIISIYEYYFTYGDAEFVRLVWDRVKLLYEFILSRLDENGLVVAREGDWIFIDWSDMDKDGPLCAEQLLLVHAHRIMGRLAALVGEDGEEYVSRADALMQTVDRLFYREDRGAYIDSYTSGKENVTRHANIFAILFDLVDNNRKARIVEKVLSDPSVTPITTPYFKLYELMALCSVGKIAEAQRYMREYWGGMLELGATSIWEEYDPTKSVPECYAMYGRPYQKSLCHAWSCGPIYLVGRYCLGVYPTSPAYATYRVEPQIGEYTSFSGVVPTEKGDVRVSYENGAITVCSDLDGGVLCFNGREYPIIKGTPLTVK